MVFGLFLLPLLMLLLLLLLLLEFAIYNGTEKKRKNKENDFKKYNFDVLYCINCMKCSSFTRFCAAVAKPPAITALCFHFFIINTVHFFLSTSFICFALFFVITQTVVDVCKLSVLFLLPAFSTNTRTHPLCR